MARTKGALLAAPFLLERESWVSPVAGEAGGLKELAWGNPVRVQQTGGIPDHQQYEQQYRQADAQGKGPDGSFRGALVPDQVKQAAEQAADDGDQEQDDYDLGVHDLTGLVGEWPAL